jgi:hypothetical protein
VITLNPETKESSKTMNTFTRKSLYAALAGVGALGVTGAAQAVNVNPNGLGQVLLYPYYTVRTDNVGNPYQSLLSIVNSTNSVKAVKVRFVEGKNSAEVLDFNLFLSPFDVWTTAIIPDSGGGGKIITADKSCTLPAIPAAGVPFVNFQYAASNADGATDSLDRTKEGYVEIIEMATYTSGSTIGVAATHVSGTPPCGSKLTDQFASNEQQPAQGGLFGGISLIDVLSGTDYTADAVALDNFLIGVSLYSASGTINPNLTQSSPTTSQVLVGTSGLNSQVYTSVWNVLTCGIATACSTDPVSAVLMHNQVMNEFVLDPGTKSGTDWVVTMPTKRFYLNNGTGNAPKLFQRNFNKTAGACDDVSLSLFDREEFTAPTSFSPPPPTQTNSLCWEANVITFNNSHLLGSQNETNVPTAFVNGWLNLGFPIAPSPSLPTNHLLANIAGTTVTTLSPVTSIGGRDATYFGLPVIGFAVQDFVNGTLTGAGGITVQSAYGGNFVQKSTSLVTHN